MHSTFKTVTNPFCEKTYQERAQQIVVAVLLGLGKGARLYKNEDVVAHPVLHELPWLGDWRSGGRILLRKDSIFADLEKSGDKHVCLDNILNGKEVR